MLVYGKKRKVDDCPNRLFLSFLNIWRDDAAQKESKSYHTYNKAYKSLEKYPLPLQNGKEAIIIENFGEKICAMLDRKLETEASTVGLTSSEYLEQSRSVPDSWWESLAQQTKEKKKGKKEEPKKSRPRAYVPQVNSGAYAILLTLHRHAPNSWLKKADLQRLAQPLATKSFTIPDHGSHYTAWSSMATLLSKNLVKKFSNPAKFEITEDGKELAARIESGEKTSSQSFEDSVEKENVKQPTSSTAWQLSDSDSDAEDSSTQCNGVGSSGLRESTSQALNRTPARKKNIIVSDKIDLTLSDGDIDSQDDCIVVDSDKPSSSKAMRCPSLNSNSVEADRYRLRPGSFRVVLCVDTRELSGDKRKSELRRLLDASGVKYIERVLQVGDFAWIAQEKHSLGSSVAPRELVLDYIVERKCMADLAQSIRDKRFREQKIRLKQCGVKRVIYLAEDMSQVDHQSLPGNTLRQALINSMIVDDMFIKYTDDLTETALYLKSMTAKLANMYESLTLSSCSLANAKARLTSPHSAIVRELLTFDDFNDDSMKSKGLTTNELFIKQLMQIHGMSFHKANAIAQVYTNPLALHKAYRNISTDKKKEALLSKIKFGLNKRNVGISVSRSVYHVFNAS